MIAEFSRTFALDAIGATPRAVHIEANEDERRALAKRFDLIEVITLSAEATLVARAAAIDAAGTVTAAVVQTCVVTSDPVPATIDASFNIRFVEPGMLAAGEDEEEIELHDSDLDVVAHDGGSVDLGEAVAQTLGLALDPFPRSEAAPPEGETVWKAGPDASPFAGLKNLIKD